MRLGRPSNGRSMRLQPPGGTERPSAPAGSTPPSVPDELPDSTAGDLLYGDEAGEWENLPIGSEGDVLTVTSGLPAWGSPANGVTAIGAWAKGNISLLTGSDSLLKNTWTKANTDEIPQLMPVAGEVLYLSAGLDGDIGGVGDDLVLTLYKDTGGGLTATGLTLTLSGGAGTEQYAYPGTGGPVSFNAGDRLAVYGQVAGSPAARELTVTVWGRFT